MVFAVELDEGAAVKPVQLCRVLAEDSKKRDSSVLLLVAVATEAEEYVPGSKRAVEGSVLFGVAGIVICTPAVLCAQECQRNAVQACP